MSVYVKVNFRNEYHSLNFAKAVYGFQQMGAHIITYQSLDEIIDQIDKDDIVIDYIHQMQTIFHKFDCNYQTIDYPSCFNPFYGRKIWKSYLSVIDQNPDLWNVFIKPLKTKTFTGKVIRSVKDLRGCGIPGEDVEIYCSEVVEFKAEYRMFIIYDEIHMVSLYKGDYHYNYDPKVVDEILEAFKTWEDRPMGCGIDIGVTKDHQTLVVEINDGYSLGSYGIFEIPYAKLMSARYSQIMKVKDQFDFRHYRITH